MDTGHIGLIVFLVFIFTTLHAIGRVADRNPARAWLLLSIALFSILQNFLESSWMRGGDGLWLMFVVVVVEAGRYWRPFHSGLGAGGPALRRLTIPRRRAICLKREIIGFTAYPFAARIWIDEPRTPKYPLRFPDAGEPSAFWRSSAHPWTNDRAGATPRPHGGHADQQRVQCRGMPQGHAGLLPRGCAGLQTAHWERPLQAAPAPVPCFDQELRAAVLRGASDAAGPGLGSARQTVRSGQPGVLVPR